MNWGMTHSKKTFSSSTIHAICVLLKPNESRLNSELTQTLEMLLGRLPKSAANNVIFCFTHSEPFQFCPAQSFVILESYLKELKSRTGVEIRATE